MVRMEAFGAFKVHAFKVFFLLLILTSVAIAMQTNITAKAKIVCHNCYPCHDFDDDYPRCEAKNTAFMTEIPIDIPNNVRKLTIQHTKVRIIGTEKLKRITMCLTIIFSFNKISVIEPNAFQTLTQHNESFNGLANLWQLFLDNNKLTALHAQIFSNLENLKTFYVKNNTISYVQTNTFLVEIRNIDLTNNSLQDTDWLLLSSYKELQILILKQNYISIHPNTFKKYRNINKLSLAHNNIVHLYPKFISSRSGRLILDLSYNHISYIPNGTFLNVKCLKVLYLNKNRITSLVFDMLGKLRCLEQLYFNDNQIIFIEVNTFEHTPKLKTLYLKGNNFCSVDWVKYLKNKLQFFDFPCPEFSVEACVNKCNKTGKISHVIPFNNSQCQFCDCQCPKHNCSEECVGHAFKIVTGKSGCIKCSCFCPMIDCDAQCEGESIGIAGPKDKAGCSTTCDGCTNPEKRNESIIYAPDIAKEEQNITTMISIPFGVLPLLAILISFSIKYLKNRGKERNTEKLQETDIEKKSELEIFLENLNPDLACQVKECWIEPDAISVMHLIGRGNFGTVWSGRFQKALYKSVEVAIKKTKAEYKDIWKVENRWTPNNELRPHFYKVRKEIETNNQVIEDLLQEAMMMRQFDHPNVLSMFGVSVVNDKTSVILPLMRNGDLKSYLRNHSTSQTVQDLLYFALAVAKGMEYLAENKFVHCDLAARNCMIDDNLVIKVSDFGLTKDVYDTDYYKDVDKCKALPIRWMSIEAIQCSLFSTQSDVWSYGVVLWEIFCLGGHPYEDIENTDIGTYLKEGRRLDKPPLASEYMYKMMLECWAQEPSDRPSFSEIISILNRHCDVEADYMEVEGAVENGNEQSSVDHITGRGTFDNSSIALAKSSVCPDAAEREEPNP